MEEAVELPECPVCLQPYDGESTNPRVLACGHSACEDCLTQLSKPFPHTIRCPACTQLVKYPHPQGPSALPKNIDLLRFSSTLQNRTHNPDNSQKPPKPKKEQLSLVNDHQFIPNLWSSEFYSTWKNWVIPNEAVLVESVPEDGFCSVLYGRIVSSSASSMLPIRCLLKENQKVSLFRVGCSLSDNDSKFRYSYIAKIMQTLHGMKEEERAELGLILRASCSRLCRICKVCGLWYNTGDRCVYMVCERYGGSLSDKLGDWSNGFEDENKSSLDPLNFSMIGIEICETLSSLHLEGLITGCLALCCFNFDDFGHVYVDFNEVLAAGKKFRKMISEGVSGKQKIDSKALEVSFLNEALKTHAFVSPELLFELFQKEGINLVSDSSRYSVGNGSDVCSLACNEALKTHAFVSPELLFELFQKEGIDLVSDSSRYSVGYGSDVWSLACILNSILIGKPFTEELCNLLFYLTLKASDEKGSDTVCLYKGWMEKVSMLLQTKLGSEFGSLQEILCKCLNFDPGSRPVVTDVWKSIRELLTKPNFNISFCVEPAIMKENMGHCLVLGELLQLPKETNKVSEKQITNGLKGGDCNGRVDADQAGEARIGGDLIEGLSSGHVKCINLKGHLDCITGLAVGGGFLFGSSYDKTVHVWYLQDFTYLHSFRGHEHRVMAVVFVNEEQPLCISGDSGGGIFIWSISIPFSQEPIKKWCELKDWRYSGIHALATSGTQYLYSGSGDKSIKAWSLKDYTLSCTMNGHKSVVSTLAVCDGVLYSGSWDGTIRLWCVNDHSPLTVLGEDAPGNVSSVFSLSVDRHVLVVSHENGSIKIWRNHVFMKATETHKGAIFSVGMEGKWLFTGGWDKTVTVLELCGDDFGMDVGLVGSIACDSAVTALLYWEGKLFVGHADRLIKVHYYG